MGSSLSLEGLLPSFKRFLRLIFKYCEERFDFGPIKTFNMSTKINDKTTWTNIAMSIFITISYNTNTLANRLCWKNTPNS